MAVGARGLVAGFGILATFLLLTAAPAAFYTASASTIAAHSAAFAASTISVSAVSAASAVATMFSIPLISVRFLLSADDLELAALQGRLSCGSKRGIGSGVYRCGSGCGRTTSLCSRRQISSFPATRTGLLHHARSIPALASLTSSLACGLQRHTAA